MEGSMGTPVTIRAYKYGERLHYEWPAEVIKQTDDYVMVLCRAGRTFTHHTKGKTFTMPYPSIELFFLKEWYTVAITFQSADRLMYYCNIAQPSVLDDQVLSFVDLDLDYIKEPDESWKVVDEEEFIAHQQQFGYSPQLVARAEQALEELKQLIEGEQFPFNGEIDAHLLESVL
ncbi:DUF402 domain-containing protein [Paenibacillus sp. FSL W7-1287]|uniref:DUF402 domain-containing protein n=1 Tax=Paenibacillus sp. FSL W7-1287 TaxID=2954538 RepID=UPI0030FA16A1